MPRHALSALLALVLAACASGTAVQSTPAARTTPAAAPPTRVTETSSGYVVNLEGDDTELRRVLDVPPERVWSALPAVYQALGMEAEVRDEASHTYGTRRYSQSRLGGMRTTDLVRCGMQGTAPPATGGHRVRLTAITRLQPMPGEKTLLLFDVSGTAISTGGTNTGSVPCISTGKLEQHIAALVYAQAKQ